MMPPAATLRRERPLTGRHVLIATLAFFLAVIAANLVFVFLALDTFSGTVSDRAYQEGLAYNERLAAAAEQKDRGWTGDLALIPGGLSLTLADRAGDPVGGLVLVARISRPATRAADREVLLAEVVPGRYVAATALDPGNWLVVIEGSDAAGRSFRTEGRLWR
jgi:nitrogen fixation protein FixH